MRGGHTHTNNPFMNTLQEQAHTPSFPALFIQIPNPPVFIGRPKWGHLASTA